MTGRSTEASLLKAMAPVVAPDTRLLLLGSLPGERSLSNQRYYDHPRNQFWRLMGRIIDLDLASLPYEKRLAALRAAGVGLWDVIASARRTGSLDADIRDHRTNDLQQLVAGLPMLRAIGFNGGTSARLGMPLLQDKGLMLLPLPSSSPAFTLSFERKLEQWMGLSPFLST